MTCPNTRLKIIPEWFYRDHPLPAAYDSDSCSRYEKQTPAEMVEVIVPDCTYAVFECKGKIPFSVQDMTRRLYGEWLPNSGYKWANAPDIERYFDGDPSSDDYICELWLPIQTKQTEEK